jgi:beta-mannosidase
MDLNDGWQAAASLAGSVPTPSQLAEAQLDWRPAQVPGTSAAALGVDDRDFDAEDWWFRCRFARPQTVPADGLTLELDGVATVAEVFLNGHPLLTTSSMWQAHAVEVGDLLVADNELLIVCRALRPLLRRRRRPSARWRTRVVHEGNLRWHRTMVFGRSPGFAPGPAPVADLAHNPRRRKHRNRARRRAPAHGYGRPGRNRYCRPRP